MLRFSTQPTTTVYNTQLGCDMGYGVEWDMEFEISFYPLHYAQTQHMHTQSYILKIRAHTHTLRYCMNDVTSHTFYVLLAMMSPLYARV